MDASFRLFGMNATKTYANKVAEHLNVQLSKHNEYYFTDKESYIKSEVNVRNCDVYIIQSLYNSPEETIAEKFTKLLFFVGSLKDASAKRITAVVPYLGYSRQDRKTESRAPITTKYIAQLLEAVGLDRLLTMDVHNLAAFQNAFRIPVDNLEGKNLFADHFMKTMSQKDNLCILATDSGDMDRARKFRDACSKKMGIEIDIAYVDKSHIGNIIRSNEIIGDIEGKTIVAIDDMISSGKTLYECDKVVDKKNYTLNNKAEFWGAYGTHGLLVGKVNENLEPLKNIIITDTIENFGTLNSDSLKKITVLSTASIFGEAIKRIHEEGGSISDLLK